MSLTQVCDLQRDLYGNLQRGHRGGGGAAAALLQSGESDLERGRRGAPWSRSGLRGCHELLEALQKDWEHTYTYVWESANFYDGVLRKKNKLEPGGRIPADLRDVCVPLKGMSLWLATCLLMLHHLDRSHWGDRTLLHPPARSSHLISFSSSTSSSDILKHTLFNFTNSCWLLYGFKHIHTHLIFTCVWGSDHPPSSTPSLHCVSSSGNSTILTDTASLSACEPGQPLTPKRRLPWPLTPVSHLPSRIQPQRDVSPPPHSIYLFLKK